ncbi:MAG TPA: TldD/PmbA family protein [Planctomycetes bacterium]|jgi:TldD protein|nr:TldD/PmbA family protein [Planctomycetota bacterium]HIL51694.1 TldD/PmbA family protein [Planctomycetota bacterium]
MAKQEMTLAREAIDAALALGADYADCRVSRVWDEELVVKNGRLGSAESYEESGLGLRVRMNGCFGFAAAPLGAELGGTALADLAQRATHTASVLSAAKVTPAAWADEPAHTAEWSSPRTIDPFSVPLEDRLSLLMAADASMAGAPETVAREASCSLRREEKWQASSEGSHIYQDLMRCGAGMSSTAAAHGQVQCRSYPASMGGNFASAGWEHILAMDLARHGGRLRDESVALCSADAAPEGERTLVIGGSQLMLQIHESVGHPNELDRVFGHEVDLAGSSFSQADHMGRFRYGSKIVNLVADSTIPGGLGTRGFDDECVAAGSWHVVRDGIFEGFHTDRTWASKIGAERSHGTSRAQGWFHPPIIRMTNLSLMPGEWDFDALIADCEDGSIFVDTVKMWSIDQRRLNFQFTCEIGWEIQDGRLARMLRNPTYQGTTPEFWGACDAICSSAHWNLWGVANCGKGNPIQLAEMSHGAAPARFRGVKLVATK